MSDRLLIALTVGILGMLMLFGSGVVAAGLACGFLTAIGFLMLALKSRRVRTFARRHPLLTDVLGTVGGYFLFPPGITAFIGAGVLGLMLTALISIERILNPGEAGRPETVTRKKERLMARIAAGEGPPLGRSP